MATHASSGATGRADRAARGTQGNNAIKPAASIEDTLNDLYEAMAVAVEHPDCPASLAYHIHDFADEITKAAEGVNESAVEAAKLRNFLPAAVSILAQGDQPQKRLKVA